MPFFFYFFFIGTPVDDQHEETQSADDLDQYGYLKWAIMLTFFSAAYVAYFINCVAGGPIPVASRKDSPFFMGLGAALVISTVVALSLRGRKSGPILDLRRCLGLGEHNAKQHGEPGVAKH